MKILISDAFDPSLPDKLTAFGEVTDDKDRLEEMDVVLVRSKTKCRKDYIDQAKNLRLIIRGGVGLDNIDVEYARSKGIQVFNTAEASAVAVAELAFALMISVPTRLVEGHMGMTEKAVAQKAAQADRTHGQDPGALRRRQHRHRARPSRHRLRDARHRLRSVPQEPRGRGSGQHGGAPRRVRLHVAPRAAHRRNPGNDQYRDHRPDEGWCGDHQHRPRGLCRRGRHESRARVGQGPRLRHRRFRVRPAAGRLPLVRCARTSS